MIKRKGVVFYGPRTKRRYLRQRHQRGLAGRVNDTQEQVEARLQQNRARVSATRSAASLRRGKPDKGAMANLRALDEPALAHCSPPWIPLWQPRSVPQWLHHKQHQALLLLLHMPRHPRALLRRQLLHQQRAGVVYEKGMNTVVFGLELDEGKSTTCSLNDGLTRGPQGTVRLSIAQGNRFH